MVCSDINVETSFLRKQPVDDHVFQVRQRSRTKRAEHLA